MRMKRNYFVVYKHRDHLGRMVYSNKTINSYSLKANRKFIKEVEDHFAKHNCKVLRIYGLDFYEEKRNASQRLSK